MIWAEIAHWMALLPLACLAVAGRRCDSAYWWIAFAFSFSWLADTAAHWVNPWAVTLVYPITQSTIILAALLPRQDTIRWLAGFAVVAGAAIVLKGTKGPDVLLHSVASVSVVWAVWRESALPANLRLALVVYFGVGLLAWLIHVQWLVVETWWPYQGSRLAGLLLFCYAAWRCTPTLKLARA